MTELIEKKFLTLSLGEERYAIPIGRVREVLECSRVTRLPRMAPYMKGIIGLRGAGLPVMDLRSRFGMPEAAASAGKAVIVAETSGEEGAQAVGILADAVHEVVEIEDDRIEAPPRFGAGPGSEFLMGIGRIDSIFVLILDMDLVFDESGRGLPARTEAMEA
jgi:purine-binding chemotaxis protein CheW